MKKIENRSCHKSCIIWLFKYHYSFVNTLTSSPFALFNEPGGNSSNGLKASDVDPRLVFHHGVPSGATKFTCDNIHNILALSTNDGRIKLFGKDNAQVLLESNKLVPSKFLQFIQNQGILINVTSNNHIEVWDIDKKLLSDLYIVKEEITSFAVIQHSLYM
ncbi:putative transcription factor WD40-like family [Medicago truncatula]|uniref:Putative transcription factor WD40-like family n=1 Tax=Medicago truncatula TaxID=3880 RepID=A0A396HM69_MEDTR|nr:putative transcription factor WD40-like family [Medicago truncatula]